MPDLVVDECVSSRKQSASDLQSRLKTRKLLGVGELDKHNGEIYRSKISQLLGINENLYVRLPKGLLYWNGANQLYFCTIGLLCVTLPRWGMWMDCGYHVGDGDTFGIRLYGCVLMAYGVLFRSFRILQERENRVDMANLLSVTALLHAAIAVGTFLNQHRWVNFPFIGHLIAVAGNIAYQTFIDGQGGMMRSTFRWFEDTMGGLMATPTIEKRTGTPLPPMEPQHGLKQE